MLHANLLVAFHCGHAQMYERTKMIFRMSQAGLREFNFKGMSQQGRQGLVTSSSHRLCTQVRFCHLFPVQHIATHA